MDINQFTAAMTARGFVTDGKLFCGVYEGYPLSVTYLKGSSGGKTTFSMEAMFEQKVPRKMFKQVRQRTRGYSATQRGSAAAGSGMVAAGAVAGGALGAAIAMNSTQNSALPQCFSITSTVQDFEPAFDGLVACTVAVAREFGLMVPALCPICRQPGCDSYAYYGGAYRPVHGHCVQTDSYRQQEKVQLNEATGSYGTGVIGAVLGGVVGALPTVLLIVFLNVISAWLCALIPLGAYFGYKLLRGRLSGPVPLLSVILVSLLMVPVTEYLSYAFIFLREIGYFLTPADYLTLFQEYAADMIVELGKTLLFVGLGVVIVFGIIRRGNSHTWQQASFSAATLRPMNPPMAGPAAPPPCRPKHRPHTKEV
ncbi:hypothetical protein LJC60_03660 [Ruminococcaceae bacterium OttesenSCG-928-D13]|nr:hypothetical protein [Ruminococcaceae bacterium OttesenSCG-928-D13]